MNYKEAICEALRAEADFLFKEKETRRAIALKKSAKILSEFKTIRSIQDITGIGGIGKGTLRRAQEVFDGSSKWTNCQPDSSETKVEDLIEAVQKLTVVKKVVKTVGSVGSVFSLLLADSWNKLDIDPTGWWMSEKLDGIRCYWNGEQFLTRNDNVIDAPDWVLEQMPKDVCFDGELYCGRGNFEMCINIKGDGNHEYWKKYAKYHVFDILECELSFEKRVRKIIEVTKDIDFIVDVKHKECRSREHLVRKLKCVVENGGEGIMLRQRKSKYVGKRSKTLLKCKPEYDAEAKVIDHVPDKDSLVMLMESGQTFRLSTKQQPKSKYPIGTIITYKFNEVFAKSGKPRFPVLMRIREDATEPKDFKL